MERTQLLRLLALAYEAGRHDGDRARGELERACSWDSGDEEAPPPPEFLFQGIPGRGLVVTDLADLRVSQEEWQAIHTSIYQERRNKQ